MQNKYVNRMLQEVEKKKSKHPFNTVLCYNFYTVADISSAWVISHHTIQRQEQRAL